jgi:trk system potassium uptake protein TrkH
MLHFLGFILLVIGAVFLVPIPAAIVFEESYLIPYFVIPAAIALFAGFFLRRRFPRVELRLGTAMVLVTIAWILISLFSCMPYMLGTRRLRDGTPNPAPMSFVDSYFESMSGFTATGLTMLGDPDHPLNVETVPRTILFWRSLTEWVGGLGVIVLFLAALIGAGRAARKMYAAEARAERIEPSILETTRSLWKIYVLFTLLGIIGLFFVGMPLFDSVNHSMTGIATGGFTVRTVSFAGYASPILLIAIIIMLMGATSFAIHRKVMAGQWREFFRSPEVRLILVLIVLATIIIVWDVGWDVGFQHSIFQTTSAVTGTGFSTTELARWPDLSKGVLTGLMIIGGGYGSTSSAIKLIRAVIIIKAVHWTIKRSFLPERAVVPMKIAGRTYTEREIMETSIYAFIYVVVLLAGAIVLMMLGNTFVNSMFESASAQGNVGLSVGITSVAMPLAGKIMFIIQMLIGRLEILPVIALMSYFIAKVPRRRGIV